METKDVEGDQKKYLTLWAHSTTDGGTWDIFLYAPYWIVNKSELPIEIRVTFSGTSRGRKRDCPECRNRPSLKPTPVLGMSNF